ncbi:hypothetical protein RB597_006017 [Gaeumannomyces tritici]
MRGIPPVLTGARPIGVAEFKEAVDAICRPRFPNPVSAKAKNRPAPVALAISGGVDSMALAYLCNQTLRQYRSFDGWRVADNPVDYFIAVTIDHGYREGSAQEAARVSALLRKYPTFRIAEPSRIQWRKLLRKPGHFPSAKEAREMLHELPNFETVAREQRFQIFARRMQIRGAVSMFLAHHEDDQYETVLMRLLNYPSPRGLMGIPPAGDMPHIDSIFGSHASGFIDDQLSSNPMYRMTMLSNERAGIQDALKSEMALNWEELERELRDGASGDSDPLGVASLDFTPGRRLGMHSRHAPLNIAPCPVEDGGAMIYRPLLEFSKDRLVATCVHNRVSWFEDESNKDATLTQRNALRHLVQNYTLPVVLQKPAILKISKRCRAKYEVQQAEASRLLQQTDLFDFQPNAGTIVVKLPELSMPRPRRASSISAAREFRGRLKHLRTVAGLLIRKLLRVASPMPIVTTLDNMQPFITRLFPSLAPTTEGTAAPGSVQGFVLNHVHFTPLFQETEDGSKELHWRLARAPHISPSRQRFPALVNDIPRYLEPLWWRPRSELKLSSKNEKHYRFRPYDGGRFWFNIVHRLPNRILVGPLEVGHLRRFREQLPDDAERKRLDGLLRRYAPGKVRWTLPAIYTLGPVDWALREPNLPDTDMSPQRQVEVWSSIWGDGNASINLVAIPTLGVHLQGIDEWIKWEVRFRKVGTEVLKRVEACELQRLDKAVSWLRHRAPLDKRRPPRDDYRLSDMGVNKLTPCITAEDFGERKAACAT